MSIDQNDERDRDALIAADCIESALWSGAAVERNHELILFEEHVADADGLLQQAAAIAANVENHAVEFGFIEIFERGRQVCVGRFIESRDARVADSGMNQRIEIYAGAGNFIAGYADFDGLLPAFAAEGNFDLRALGAFQELGDLPGVEAFAGFVVDFQNGVAWADSGFIRRGAEHRSDYVGEILARRYGHANAIIAALLLFLEAGVLLGIEEIRVRVEDAEHIGDRAIVDGFVGVDRRGVIMLDDGENFGEAAVGVLEIAGAGASGANRTAIKAAGNCGNSQNTDKKKQPALG